MMWGGRKSSRRIHGVHNTDEESIKLSGRKNWKCRRRWDWGLGWGGGLTGVEKVHQAADEDLESG